jgi:hypothetical protein
MEHGHTTQRLLYMAGSGFPGYIPTARSTVANRSATRPHGRNISTKYLVDKSLIAGRNLKDRERYLRLILGVEMMLDDAQSHLLL